jgi:hypothetical protein
MATAAFRKGFSGELSGIRTLFTNQLPVLTVGTRTGTGANVMEVDGANQNVNYADVAKAGTVNGRHMTQTLNITDATTAAATFKAGEVFTIAGVNAYDNRKQAAVSPARLQQFTVVADAVAWPVNVGAGHFPGDDRPGLRCGRQHQHQHCPRDRDRRAGRQCDITFIGAASAVLSPRVVMQKQAVVVNTVPLILPASDTSMRRRCPRSR